ncbi:MAG: glycosyltransferase family 2 protein, partial [Syntrophothermus sp.]
MPTLSLIIPVYNEEENLPLLMESICISMQSLNREWEAIFVDDGSSDHSLDALKRLVETNPEHVRVVVFRRNFGQTAAIAAGIDHARGEIIILLDADLQNDPADIPMLLAKLDEGYDLVSGWRKDRQDNRLTRTIPSNIANGLISRVTGVHLHDYGCTLKAYRRDALEGFRLYGEMHRFIPVFAHSVGAKIAELPVHHHARKFGKAKYGLERTVKVILDLFTVKFLL